MMYAVYNARHDLLRLCKTVDEAVAYILKSELMYVLYIRIIPVEGS